MIRLKKKREEDQPHPEPTESETDQEIQMDALPLQHLPQTDEPDEPVRPEEASVVGTRIHEVVAVLADLKALGGGVSRMEWVGRLKADLGSLYAYSGGLLDVLFDVFSPAEAVEFIEASERGHPLTIRVNTLKARMKEVGRSLTLRGAKVEPLAPWSKVSLKVVESKVPIGATPDYLAGHYMLQSASSLLPVMALGP